MSNINLKMLGGRSELANNISSTNKLFVDDTPIFYIVDDINISE